MASRWSRWASRARPAEVYREHSADKPPAACELRMWLRRVSHTLRPKVWARRLPRQAPEDDAPFLAPHISMPLSMTLPPSADSFFLASFLHLT